MAKTISEINEKIKQGKAVVFTAEQAVAMALEQGVAECAKKIDVVTAATFGAMCSSGAMLNFGHTDPPTRMGEITLNDVSAYGGLAAVDHISAQHSQVNTKASSTAARTLSKT